MSRRLISPDASATISGDVAAGTLVDGRVRLAGGELAYTRAGEGPVVLLIHGLGGTRRTWRALILGLAIRFTVIAPDLPAMAIRNPLRATTRSARTPAPYVTCSSRRTTHGPRSWGTV